MKTVLLKIAKVALLLAAIWAVSISLYIFFTPLQVESITATDVQSNNISAEVEIQEVSWYEVQGVWGTVVLAIFAVMYTGAATLVWRHKHIAGGVWISLAFIMTYLAGFSVGPFYLPSAVLAAIGGLLLLISALFPARIGATGAQQGDQTLNNSRSPNGGEGQS